MAALKLVFLSLLVCFAFVHSSEATCGGTFTATSGTITSPGFPNNYTNNVNCIYIITAPTNQRITLNFTHFDLQADNASRCLDYVMMREGNSSSSPKIDTFCNNTLPDMRRSFGHQMWIQFFTDSSVVRSGFRATYTTGTYDNSFFLITTSGGSIFRMDAAESITNYNIGMTLSNPIAVDFDPVEQRVYWSQVGTAINVIASASLTGNNIRVVKDPLIGAVIDGLAVDPFSRLLFYTDDGNNVIAMMTLSTFSHKTIINSSLDRPRAIVLHVTDGVMFWTDWGGPAKIERANYDGSDRRTLVLFNLLYPNALALDVANNHLYWADAGTDHLESVNLDGGDRSNPPIIRINPARHFFGMALFRNALYITDWGPDTFLSKSSIIIRKTLGPYQNSISIHGKMNQRMNDIHAYDQDWATSGPNGCGNNNGGCSSFCIPLSGNRSKCLCPDGESLLADNATCVNARLISTPSEIKTTPRPTTTTPRPTTTTPRPTATTPRPTTTTPRPTTTTPRPTTTTPRPTTTTPRPITNAPTSTTTTPPSTPELTDIPVVVKASHDLPFIADGARDLSVTCDLAVPVTRYAWNVQCSRKSGNWCVFRPTAEDDGKKVTCTVTLADGRVAAGSLVLSLLYPPQTPPYILGYESGSPLQVGDSLTMTCTVYGGKPLVSAVIFSCADHHDNTRDMRGMTEVHSLMVIRSLRKEDNGTMCECSGQWLGSSDFYPPRHSVTLLVLGGGGASEKKTDLIPIIGGAVGGVVVVVLIIVIIVIVKRRNNTYNKTSHRNRLQTDYDLDLNDPVYTEIPDLPLSAYDVPPFPDRHTAPAPPTKHALSPADDYLTPIAMPAHSFPDPTAHPDNTYNKASYRNRLQTDYDLDRNDPVYSEIPDLPLSAYDVPPFPDRHTAPAPPTKHALSPADDYLTPIAMPAHSFPDPTAHPDNTYNKTSYRNRLQTDYDLDRNDPVYTEIPDLPLSAYDVPPFPDRLTAPAPPAKHALSPADDYLTPIAMPAHSFPDPTAQPGLKYPPPTPSKP